MTEKNDILQHDKSALPPQGAGSHGAQFASDEVLVDLGAKNVVLRSKPDDYRYVPDDHPALPFKVVPASRIRDKDERKKLAEEFRAYLTEQSEPAALKERLYHQIARTIIESDWLCYAGELCALHKNDAKLAELAAIGEAAQLELHEAKAFEDDTSFAQNKLNTTIARFADRMFEHYKKEKGNEELYQQLRDINAEYTRKEEDIYSVPVSAWEKITSHLFARDFFQPSTLEMYDKEIIAQTSALLNMHFVPTYRLDVDAPALSAFLKSQIEPAVAHYEKQLEEANEPLKKYLSERKADQDGTPLQTLSEEEARTIWEKEFLPKFPPEHTLPRRLMDFALRQPDLKLYIVNGSNAGAFYPSRTSLKGMGVGGFSSPNAVYMGRVDDKLGMAAEELCHNAINRIYKNETFEYHLSKLWYYMASDDFAAHRETACDAIKKLKIEGLEQLAPHMFGSEEGEELWIRSVRSKYNDLKDFQAAIELGPKHPLKTYTTQKNDSRPWLRNDRSDPRRELFFSAIKADLRRLGGEKGIGLLYNFLGFSNYRLTSRGAELPVKVLVKMAKKEWNNDERAVCPHLTYFVEEIMGRDMDAVEAGQPLPTITPEEVKEHQKKATAYAKTQHLHKNYHSTWLERQGGAAPLAPYRKAAVKKLFSDLPVQMDNNKDCFVIHCDLMTEYEITHRQNLLKLCGVPKEYKEKSGFKGLKVRLHEGFIKTDDHIILDANMLYKMNVEVYDAFQKAIADKSYEKRLAEKASNPAKYAKGGGHKDSDGGSIPMRSNTPDSEAHVSTLHEHDRETFLG